MEYEYHLASKELTDHYSVVEKSAVISRFGDPVCIIKIDNYDKLEKWANQKGEAFLLENNIWCREITNCNVDVSQFNFTDMMRAGGLFEWIISTHGASTEKNICAIIGGICEHKKMEPTAFFNAIKYKEALKI